MTKYVAQNLSIVVRRAREDSRNVQIACMQMMASRPACRRKLIRFQRFKVGQQKGESISAFGKTVSIVDKSYKLDNGPSFAGKSESLQVTPLFAETFARVADFLERSHAFQGALPPKG